MKHTPQVLKIYPSTVYSGQDLCFEVTTDQASGYGEPFKSVKVGGEAANLEPYAEIYNSKNVDWLHSYHQCAIASPGEAKPDVDVTLTATAGKYAISDFAKSFDGTSTYTVRRVPKITEVSHSQVNTKTGSIITITGEGFFYDPALTTVKVEENACKVHSLSDTEIKCQLEVTKSDFSDVTVFSGGIGAHVIEYDGITSENIDGSSIPIYKHFTDITARPYSNDHEGVKKLTRQITTWFIPPQDGDYTFHGSCDAKCQVEFSTTPDDTTTATNILTARAIGWRNTWSIDSQQKSDPQTLVKGKRYYMNIIFDDDGPTDTDDEYMNIGFTINDDSTKVANSYRGWTKGTVDPKHVFESLIFEIPENPDLSYRIQFHSDSDYCQKPINKAEVIFKVSPSSKGNTDCITNTFHSRTPAYKVRNDLSHFFNLGFRLKYGDDMSVVKEEIKDGDDKITGYRFIVNLRYAIGTPTFEKIDLFQKNTNTEVTKKSIEGSDFNVTYSNKDLLTKPLEGSYRFKVRDQNNGEILSEDIKIIDPKLIVLRKIYEAAPFLLGKIELSESFSTYLDFKEGRELFWRTSDSASGYTLEIVNSVDDPLNIPDKDGHPITIQNENTYSPPSNHPYYEVIPAEFLRTVQTEPQVTVSSNGVTAACPSKDTCGINFVSLSGTINSYIHNKDYTEWEIKGTGIQPEKVEYVSFGRCICSLHPSHNIYETGLHCILEECPSGNYEVYVQTTEGAMTPKGSNTVNIPITVKSVIPIELYEYGGQEIKFFGANFPSSFAHAESLDVFSVEFSDGKSCVVTSVSFTEIICISPAGLTGPEIDLNLKINELTYTKKDIPVLSPSNEVTAVDKTSLSPVEKQNILITADAKPSDDKNDYHGLLVSSTKTLKMKVNDITANGDKFDYNVRFPGAPKGDIYNVYLVYKGERFKSLLKVSTETSITGIEIDKGSDASIHGGNIIILTGVAFSTDINDLALVVGSQEADIVSSSGTEVKARIPSTKKAGKAEVGLFQKPNIESPCAVSGGCSITYVDDGQTLDHTVITVENGVATLAGSGFGGNPIGYIDDILQTTISASTKEVKIDLNNIPDPLNVKLKVRTDGANLPEFTVAVPLTQKLLNITPNTGSIAGEKITLKAFGVGTKTTSNIMIVDSNNNNLCRDGSIIQVDSSTITCVTNANHDFTAGIKFRLSFTYKNTYDGRTSVFTLNCIDDADCTFTSKASSTPQIKSHSLSGDDLSIEMNSNTYDDTYTATVYYGKQSSVAHSISGTTVTAKFAEGFTPGTNAITVSFEKNNLVAYSAPYNAKLLTGIVAGPSSSTSCSFAGGCQIPITLRDDKDNIVANSGLKTGAAAGDISVTVCGAPATFDLDASTSDTLIAIAPNYVNLYSQEKYKIVKDKVLTGTLKEYGTSSGSNAFDGITTNKVDGYKNVGVGYDFGTGNIAQLTSVRYFMGQMDNKPANCIDKVHFQSSSNGNDWVTLFSGDRFMKKGWNSHKFKTPAGSQYFRLFFERLDRCPVFEIEMIGNVFINDSATSRSCDVVVKIGEDSPTNLVNKVTYEDAATTTVTDITPRYGGSKGGDLVTITGTGFNADVSQTSFVIDGISCNIQSVTSDTIT